MLHQLCRTHANSCTGAIHIKLRPVFLLITHRSIRQSHTSTPQINMHRPTISPVTTVFMNTPARNTPSKVAVNPGQSLIGFEYSNDYIPVPRNAKKSHLSCFTGCCAIASSSPQELLGEDAYAHNLVFCRTLRYARLALCSTVLYSVIAHYLLKFTPIFPVKFQ